MMRQLFIARGTLRKHISNIRKKLGAHSIRDVVRLQQTIAEVEPVSTLRFSPRGREVFMFVREGLPNKQIAERMGISLSGVKRHREKMLLQNDCKSIMELIAKYNGTGGERRKAETI